MSSRDQMAKFLSAMQGVKVALETHLAGLESHARNLASTHAVEIEHRQAMHSSAQTNMETLQRMFDWFTPPKDDAP